jgi:hypothetical protein
MGRQAERSIKTPRAKVIKPIKNPIKKPQINKATAASKKPARRRQPQATSLKEENFTAKIKAAANKMIRAGPATSLYMKS